MPEPFIEVDFAQHSKAGQGAPGDVFVSKRLVAEGGLVCVLADGLGSGIKANVLATLTATMAMKYARSDMDIRKVAQVIMATLPVCSQRKIGYSTFTIVDIRGDGQIRIVEHDNPPYVLLHGDKAQHIMKQNFDIETTRLGRRRLYYSSFQAEQGVRLIVYSDGISQSGMGSPRMPLGWTDRSAIGFLRNRVRSAPDISARQLCRAAVARALDNDDHAAKDDISCAVINLRRPRKLLVLTGPPIDRARDKRLGTLITEYAGRTAVCGGTTANIVSRELGKPVEVDLRHFDPDVPPASRLARVDLVTEGTLTMSRAAELLNNGTDPEQLRTNAAVQLVDAFLQSDIIEFVVGTKINEAHQDPNLPVELDIRRNLIRRIVRILNEKYMKRATCEFI
jgi:hypothetical protein